MKRQLLIITASFVIFFMALVSQSFSKSGSIQVKGNVTPLTHGGYRLFSPQWSPDGKYIAMTGDNYQGIWIMDAKAYDMRPLCNDERIGYGFVWSADSREIAGRVVKVAKHRRLSAIEIFEIKNGLSRLVTDYRQRLGLPAWADEDYRICYMVDEKLEIVSSERKVRPASAKDGFLHKEQTVLFQSYGRMIISTLDKTRKTIIVNPSNRFLNPRLSPNRQKIAFEMTDGRIYVMNINGTEIHDLGVGSHPHWAPTSDYVVYFIAQDDGERVTASDLFISDTKGRQKIELTNTQDRIEMHPDWSPDGQTIIFDEYKTGIIYQLKLEKGEEKSRRK